MIKIYESSLLDSELVLPVCEDEFVPLDMYGEPADDDWQEFMSEQDGPYEDRATYSEDNGEAAAIAFMKGC